MKTRLMSGLGRGFKGMAREWLLRRTRHRPEVFLTFDDGPHPTGTPALLEVLADNGVPATFFLVGQEAELRPEMVDAIVAGGHTLGNHSWDHRRFGSLSASRQWRQMRATERLLAGHDHRRRHPFRAPQGRFRPAFGLWLALAGRGPIHWSLDSGDGECSDADELIARLHRQPPQPGDVLLFHDDSPATPGALARLLPEWRAAGLRFAHLPGWEVAG